VKDPLPTKPSCVLLLFALNVLNNCVDFFSNTGTHWLWEVVCMLMKQKAERIDAIKEWNMIEGMQQTLFDSMPSPRILNTHIYFRHLPKDFQNRKCKILYMLRNPKDVAVSFYNHHVKVLEYEYSGSWEHYLTRYLKGDSKFINLNQLLILFQVNYMHCYELKPRVV
jgi:hypothetical protein